MAIYETDTKLLWIWSGSTFEREEGKGLLGTNKVTASVTDSAGAYQMVCQLTAQIPEGGRTVKVEGCWSTITTGPAKVALFGPAGTKLAEVNTLVGQGGTVFTTHVPAGSGALIYSLQVQRTTGTNATLVAAATTPATLTVTEL